jgi:DNA polymerase elongation subunit (family B)
MSIAKLLDRLLPFDIETIPCQSLGPDDFKDRVKVPGNYKKEEAIEKYKEDHAEEAWLKTSFDGMYGEIVSIAWAEGEGEVQSTYRPLDGSEADVLESFFSAVRPFFDKHQVVWMGHNITGFDLRFLWQRAVILGVDPGIPIPVNAKPWSDTIRDTLYMWKGTQTAGGSLDAICKAFGLEGKGDITGADVWPLMQAGEHEKVGLYNQDDVEKVRTIYKRMKFIN